MTVGTRTTSDGRGPLDGLRVLSVAANFPGPYATMLLADLGADVVSVERPPGGDTGRQFGGLFAALNRNKRSIALDLTDPAGRDLLLRLAERSDVFVEGFRPGTAARLGIDYPAVSAQAPHVVYVSISAFGQTGPYRHRRGHDLSIQAMAGLGAGRDGRHGTIESVPWADISSGLFAVVGVLAALHQRAATGRGTHVDVSMADSLIAALAGEYATAWNPQGGPGLPAPLPGYGVFTTADGRQISVSVAYEDHLWERLCGVVDLPDAAGLSFHERLEHGDELRAAVATAMSKRTLAELEPALDAAGVPFGPVRSPAEVLDDPQVRARRTAVPVVEAGARTAWYVRQPLRFDGVPGTVRRPTPAVGQHTREILCDLGLDDAAQAELVRRKVVATNYPQASQA